MLAGFLLTPFSALSVAMGTLTTAVEAEWGIAPGGKAVTHCEGVPWVQAHHIWKGEHEDPHPNLPAAIFSRAPHVNSSSPGVGRAQSGGSLNPKLLSICMGQGGVGSVQCGLALQWGAGGAPAVRKGCIWILVLLRGQGRGQTLR